MRKPDGANQVVECMKEVVVWVRRISADVDSATPEGTPSSTNSMESVKQQGRLKMRLSQTANNLITAAKSHASAAGLAPVSLVDAAASNLTVAVIDLVREVKIRQTSPEELERLERDGYEPMNYTSAKPSPIDLRGKATFSGDMGNMVPNGINGRNNNHVRNVSSISSINYTGFSRYSRSSQSVNGDTVGTPPNSKPNGLGVSAAMGMLRESGIEEFKNYLEDSTALLVRSIQPLVNTIRAGANNPQDARRSRTTFATSAEPCRTSPPAQTTPSTTCRRIAWARRSRSTRRRYPPFWRSAETG